jgi:hypothetical protein
VTAFSFPETQATQREPPPGKPVASKSVVSTMR